jgi:heme exporter protein A
LTLSVEELACWRGGRPVFAGLSFRLPPGGALLLTGSNGSGKSSLLRVLASLLPAESGAVDWRGAPIADDLPGYRAALHYVGHLDALKPALSPRETLRFSAALRGGGAPAIDAALACFALEDVAELPCRWLSAGQRRRVALARLIAAPAPLWLLDEPAAPLDRDGEARLAEAIAAHRAGGGMAVVATHAPLDIPEANALVLDEFAAAAMPDWAEAL